MKTAEALTVVQPKHVSETHKPLRQLIRQSLDNYFTHLDAGLPPTQLYTLVLEEMELPLLEATLKYTKGNQCKAATLLGISRSTLRKKLKHYDLD